MPDDKLPIPQFAAKIKAKYPQYNNVDDTTLVQKIVAKYPEYQEQVDLSGLNSQKKNSLPNLSQNAGVSSSPSFPTQSKSQSEPSEKNQIDPSKYETKLNPQQEQQFQNWFDQQHKDGKIGDGDYQFYKKNGYGYDYDFRAAFLNGENAAKNGHWSDIGKKPNHETFSTESKYNGIDGFQGGTWNGDSYVPPKQVKHDNGYSQEAANKLNEYKQQHGLVEPTIDEKDPVGSALRPLRNTYQTAQRNILSNQRSVADATVNKVLPTQIQNQKVEDIQDKEKQSKRSLLDLVQTQNAIKKQFDNVKNAKQILTNIRDNNGGVIPKDNETAQYAQEGIKNYNDLSNDIVKNKGVIGAAINEELKSNSQFANNYKTLNGKIPKSYEGQLVYNYLQRHGDNINNFVEEHPEYKSQIDDLTKNFAKKYPETVAAQIGNEVSQAYEKQSNSAADFNTEGFNKKVDDIAAQLYKDNPEKLALYNQLVKDNKREYFKSAAALNSFGGTIFGGLNSTMNSLRDWTGLRNAKDRAYQQLDEEGKYVNPNAKGIRDWISESAGFGGMITQLAATGGMLKGTGALNADKVSTISRFYDDQLKDAEGRLGDNWKAKASADLSTALFTMGGNAIPVNKVKQSVENILKDVGEKESVSSVKARIGNAVKQGLLQYGKGVGEMTAITKAQQIVDAALGGKHDNEEKELENTAKSMAMGNVIPSILHGVGTYAGMKVEQPNELHDAVKELPDGIFTSPLKDAINSGDNEKVQSYLKNISEQLNSSESEASTARKVFGDKLSDLALKLYPDARTESIANTTTPTAEQTGAEVRDTENEQAGVNTTDNGLQDGNIGGRKDVGGEKVEKFPSEKWFDDPKKFVEDNKNGYITLYHGSLNEVEANHNSPLYLTPSIREANEYIIQQAKFKGEDTNGDYGHIYSIKVPVSELKRVSDIDTKEKHDTPIYSPDERGYIRIDNPSKYKLEKVSNGDALDKWNDDKIEISNKSNEIPISTEAKSNTIKETNTVEQPTSEGEKTSQPIENEPIGKSNERQPPSQEPSVESASGGEGKVTSIKNEQTKAERKERGLPEVEVEMRRKFGDAFNEGKRMVDSGEINPKSLAKELVARPRPLSAEESVGLLYDRMRIMNEHQKIMDDIQKAIDKGDDVKASVLQSELARVEDEMNINDEAARKTGYEQGLGLAARRMMIKQDYSMANLMQRARVANEGKEVPQEVREKLKDLADKLDEANKKIEDYEKQLAEAKLKREARSQKNKDSIERLKQQRRQIKENIVNKWKNAGKDTLQASVPYAQQLMAIAPEVAKLVKNYAEEGFIELKEIVDKIHSDLKDVIPEITKDDVNDIVLGKYDVEKMKATPSPEQIRMRANVEKIKKQINAELLKLKLADRNALQKGIDWLHGWHRFSILSGIPTLGKIGTAALGRGVTTRIEDVAGGLLSKIPGISSIAKNAPRHGGFSSVKAEAKAFTTWFDKMTYDDIREIMKSGQSELDYLYGDKPEYIHAVPTWMDFFGKMHQAIKSIPKRAEFFRSLEIRTQKALKDGKNLSDPIVQQELAVAAYNDGLRQVFMNDNWVTNMYKDMLRGLQNAKNKDGSPTEGARLASDIMQFMFPIIKVPTNYVGEATSYLIGGLKAAVALRRGIKNMSPERRDYVMRMMKKQSVGAAFIAIGYLNPNMFGGYYSGKRKADDLAAGDIELFGMKLPHWMSHTPLLEALQVGATIRRARDEAQAKKKPTNIFTGLHTVMGGISGQIPFVSTGSQISGATKSIDDAKKYFFRLGQSVVEPQLLQNVANWTDKNAEGETIKRDPKTFLQQLQSGVPVLRNKLPEREGYNSQLMEKAAFKPFYDKGFNLPNTVPSSIKVHDNATSTIKTLDEYPKEKQDAFIKKRWSVLEKYMNESNSKGVYVDKFGGVSLTKKMGEKQVKKSVKDLSVEETQKYLSIQGKRATVEAKKQIFNDGNDE